MKTTQFRTSDYNSPTVKQFDLLSSQSIAQVSGVQLKELEEVQEEW